MKVLVDTNIWVYATDRGNDFYAPAQHKIVGLMADGHEIVVSTQILREYAKACTSAKVLTHQQIAGNMASIRGRFAVLHETESVIAELERLMVTLSPPPIGKPVYDCNIVATMLHHGIGTILTHNVKDFKPRYDGLITVIPLI